MIKKIGVPIDTPCRISECKAYKFRVIKTVQVISTDICDASIISLIIKCKKNAHVHARIEHLFVVFINSKRNVIVVSHFFSLYVY